MVANRAISQTTSCSACSLAVGEQLFGTAPETHYWIILGYTQPLGSKAFEQAAVPEPVRYHLRRALEFIPNSRLLLIRQPAEMPLIFILARSHDTSPSLFRYDLTDYSEILNINLVETASRTTPVELPEPIHPFWLVCTNGKRDPCCTQWGLPVFNELERLVPGAVFQSSHLGGHRFAANVLRLPEGIYYGRLTTQSAQKLLTASGNREILINHYRGRACYSPAAQAAEYYLRSASGNLSADAFILVDTHQVDERSWRVRFRQIDLQIDHYLLISSEWSIFENFESCSQPDKRSRQIQYRLREYRTE